MLSFFQRYVPLLQRPAAQRTLLVAGSVLWVLYLTGYLVPANWLAYGNGDHDLTYSTLEAPRRTILEYGQFPVYNPYSAAGTDLMANPQSVHLGLFFLPSLVFGSFFGYKVAVLLGYLLGLWGAALLLMRMGAPRVVAVAGGMAWVSMGFFAYHILFSGHLNALYLFLLPWLMYGLTCFVQNGGRLTAKSWLIPLVVWLNLILGGTTYVLLYTTLFWLGCAVLLWSTHRQQLSNWAWLRYGMLTLGLGIGSSLWKIYPSWVYMRAFPRTFHDTTRVTIEGYLQMMANAMPQNTAHSFSYWGWDEHLIGGGWLALLVLLLYASEWKTLFQPQWQRWAVFLGVILWFSMGNSPYFVNPWYLFNTYFPVFNNLRVPYRSAIFPVSLLLFAFMLLYVRKHAEHRLWPLLLVAMIVQQSLWTVGISANFRQSRKLSEQGHSPLKPAHYQQIRLPDSCAQGSHYTASRMYGFIHENVALIDAYEPLPLSPIDTALAEHFVVRGGQAAAFSPNEWRFSHCHDTLLVLGQRFYPGWEITTGSGTLIPYRGMLAVANPSGQLTLRYQNPQLRTGIWLSLPFWGVLLLVAGWLLSGGNKKMVSASFPSA